LADRLLSFFSRQTGRRIEGYSAEARAALSNYSWPGNLRELRNAVERAVLFVSTSQIELDDLPGRISTVAPASREPGSGPVQVGAPVTLEELESEHIRRILFATETREEAARILGIDPSTLYRKRKQQGL
jgi:NtrC-family two-component system response regulator AlgB